MEIYTEEMEYFEILKEHSWLYEQRKENYNQD